jgi:hypothetical protein
MREKPAVKPTETGDQVTLKPIMGIRPGVYLAALYSVILLFVLFLVLALPGIRNPGAEIILKTEPAGAALRVDGVYMGTSPGNIFVSKGRRTLETVLPGFETEQAVLDVPGRVFGSLFFPLRFPVEFTLKTNDPAAVFTMAAADYAEWSFGGEPTASWQIPLSLSEGAYRARYDPALPEILTAASRFAVTRAALRDLIRAKMLLDSGGLSPSPAIIIGSAGDMLSFLSENEGSLLWLSGLLPPESEAILKASNWYREHSAPAVYNEPRLSGRFEFAGLSFTGVTGGILVQAQPYPHTVTVKGFMISDSVPPGIFETFLNENPSWRQEDNYGNEEKYIETGVSGVSWYAAQAFCQWLTQRAGREIRLPTEAEWEYAAKAGIKNMGNSGWEWCADPFSHLPFIKVSGKTAEMVGSPERSLRGGSPLNPETRASLPPDFTSPFVSFRLVMAD